MVISVPKAKRTGRNGRGDGLRRNAWNTGRIDGWSREWNEHNSVMASTSTSAWQPYSRWIGRCKPLGLMRARSCVGLAAPKTGEGRSPLNWLVQGLFRLGRKTGGGAVLWVGQPGEGAEPGRGQTPSLGCAVPIWATVTLLGLVQAQSRAPHRSGWRLRPGRWTNVLLPRGGSRVPPQPTLGTAGLPAAVQIRIVSSVRLHALKKSEKLSGPEKCV